MAKLPTDLSGREVRRALERAGFVFRRQRGSHMIFRRDDPYARVVVPDHKTLRLGTLKQIVRDAGLKFIRLPPWKDRWFALFDSPSRLRSWLHSQPALFQFLPSRSMPPATATAIASLTRTINLLAQEYYSWSPSSNTEELV